MNIKISCRWKKIKGDSLLKFREISAGPFPALLAGCVGWLGATLGSEEGEGVSAWDGNLVSFSELANICGTAAVYVASMPRVVRIKEPSMYLDSGGLYQSALAASLYRMVQIFQQVVGKVDWPSLPW